jgi:hypothetical protein
MILRVIYFYRLHLILHKSFVLRSVLASVPRHSSMPYKHKLHKMNSLIGSSYMSFSSNALSSEVLERF